MDLHFPHDPIAPRDTGASRPGRRQPDTATLLAMLDELDYGVMLVDGSGHLAYGNDAAIGGLAGHAVLALQHGLLRPVAEHDRARWRVMLERATKGIRSMERFGIEPLTLPVAATPIDGGDHPEPLVMIVLGRRLACEQISLEAYCRLQGMTQAEQRVLASVAAGLKSAGIARLHGVAVSTVRTQVSQLLRKSGYSSLRDLVADVSRLPPLRPAIRTMRAAPAPRPQPRPDDRSPR